MWHSSLSTGERSWETVLETTLASAAQFSSSVTGEGSGLAPILACFHFFFPLFLPFFFFLDLFALFFSLVCFAFLVAKFDFFFFFPFAFCFFFPLLPWLTVKRVVFLKGKA